MERRRALPPWMSEPEKTEKEPPKRYTKRTVANNVFYCMNEKELVEVAESCLTGSACEDVTPPAGRQMGNQAGAATVTMREKPASLEANLKPVTEVLDEDSCGGRDALETTCVSETDTDITEVETLPYTEQSPPHRRHKDPTPGPAALGQSAATAAEERRGSPPMKAEAPEEDEALKLVQEIFFT